MFGKEAKINAWFLLLPILIGLLAALFRPGFVHVSDVNMKSQRARARIELLMTALDTYKSEVGDYPRTEQGLQALIVRPEGASEWDGPYLKKDVPPDPWRHPLV